MSYFLQLFECNVIDRIPKNVFDIRNIVKIFGKEILEELKITHSMPGCNVCELVRVSEPEVKSKHVVICISGFL